MKNEIPEEYVSIIQVVSEDENLKNWVRNLEKLPDNLRFSECIISCVISEREVL